MNRTLLIAGALLFLLGLLQGGIVDWFTNPRLALSAHLTAVQSGTAIMVAGGIWAAVSLPPRMEAVSRWSIIAAMFGLWLGLSLSAATGASEVLPMAGTGFGADAVTETLVSALVLGSSGVMILGWALLLIGLIRKPAN